jgi:hypothetical protein
MPPSWLKIAVDLDRQKTCRSRQIALLLGLEDLAILPDEQGAADHQRHQAGEDQEVPQLKLGKETQPSTPPSGDP